MKCLINTSATLGHHAKSSKVGGWVGGWEEKRISTMQNL